MLVFLMTAAGWDGISDTAMIHLSEYVSELLMAYFS